MWGYHETGCALYILINKNDEFYNTEAAIRGVL